MKAEIREFLPEDIPQLTELWAEVFGDDRRLIERFFELLPAMGTGFTARLGGRIVGAAYSLDADFCGEHIGYLYAVAVKESCRSLGIGAELCRSCAALGKTVTLPANEGLYGWYERVIGAKAALFTETELVLPSDDEKEIMKINAAEYAKLREKLLKDRPHFSFGEAYMSFQQYLCELYGGGMFRSGGGIACGYTDNGILLVKEAIDFDALPQLCRELNADEAILRKPSPSGDVYLAADHTLPRDAVYDLTLD